MMYVVSTVVSRNSNFLLSKFSTRKLTFSNWEPPFFFVKDLRCRGKSFKKEEKVFVNCIFFNTLIGKSLVVLTESIHSGYLLF